MISASSAESKSSPAREWKLRHMMRALFTRHVQRLSHGRRLTGATTVTAGRKSRTPGGPVETGANPQRDPKRTLHFLSLHSLLLCRVLRGSRLRLRLLQAREHHVGKLFAQLATALQRRPSTRRSLLKPVQ